MYIENPEEEQNKNQSSSSPSVGAGGGGASFGQGGTSTGNTGGNPSTIAPITSNQPTQKFANVQDYLKANQPQGEEFGQKFISTVGEGIGQAKSAIDTSTQNAQNQITSGTVNANPTLISEALKTPTSVANDADKLSEFQKEYNAQYTGPSSFESSDQYTPAISATNKATQTGQELGTTGGREQLLQDVFGVYGQGNKGLDQAVLQHSSAFPGVAPLAQNFQSVQDYLKTASGNTNTAAQNAAKTTEATKAAATGAFANNLTNFQNTINSKVGTAQEAAKEKIINEATNQLRGQSEKQIRQQVNNLKGLPDAQKEAIISSLLSRIYGSSKDTIQSYLGNSPITDVTTANAATPEDYANAAAYKNLTGVDYSGVLNPANIGQAGTAGTTEALQPRISSIVENQNLQDYLRKKANEML